eukprot:18627_1
MNETQDDNSQMKQSCFRCMILFVSCCAMFGTYYCYDNPAAVSEEIKTNYNLSSTKYNVLYSIYSLPNIILPFFGGLLCDKIGAQYSLLLFLSLTTIGQLIFSLSLLHNNKLSYPLMLIGRCISGIGGESVPVAKSSLLSTYFIENHITFAMGITLSMGRIGSSLNDYLTLKLYNYFNLFYCIFFGFIILSICVIFTVIMIKCAKNNKYESLTKP